MTPFDRNPLEHKTPIIDALLALTPQMRAALDRVEWRHICTLMDQGIPVRDMLGKFGVVRIAGREMIVTDDSRLRGYLCGPIMAAMPDAR